MAWSEHEPTEVAWNGGPVDFAYGPASHLLEVSLPADGDGALTIEFGSEA